MLLAGHVPSMFGIGVTFPIPKGNSGQKVVSVEDFRGITVSPVISKVLEKGVLENFHSYLSTSENQFGFKKHVGCSHAIYALRSVVDYFVSNGSTVNLCSLDVSKAFDRLNHYALFSKLIDRFIPVNIILLLANWYSCCVGVVNWKGALSQQFTLQAGVRQGGCLSPVLFAIYVDSLILAIKKKDLGCHIGESNFGILMYADDLNLMSASVHQLQQMIDICISEFEGLDLKINVRKSSCIRFGKRCKMNCASLVVDGSVISWSESIKYLGIVFTSGYKLNIDFKIARSNFFRCFNSIYSKISKANEMVILSLIKAYCQPVLLYSLEALDLNASMMNSLDNPLFLAVGRIFKTYDKLIVNSCMYYMNIWPLRYEYLNRKISFLYKLRNVENSLLSVLHQAFGANELIKIREDLKPGNNHISSLRGCLWNRFANSIVLT